MEGKRAEVTASELIAEIEAGMGEEEQATEEPQAAVEGPVEEPADTEAAEEPVEAAGEEESEPEPQEDAADEGPQRRSWRDVDDWDGFIEAKLDELHPDAAKQRQYLSRKIQEYDEKIKALGAKAETPERPAPQQEDDPEPPMPSFDDDQATFLQKQRDHAAWVKREAVREAEQKFKPLIKQIEEVRTSVQTQQQREFEQKLLSRTQMIRDKCADDEVFQQVDEMAGRDPETYGKMAWDDEQLPDLIALARNRVEARRAKTKAVERKTTASERSINPPKPKGSVAQTKKTINADTPEEELMQIANSDEFRHLFG